MRLAIRFRGFDSQFDQPATEMIIGRPRAGQKPPEIDLSPDLTVSRPHARLTLSESEWYLEDLGSTHGTQLGGVEIRGRGRQLLRPGDAFQCGDSQVTYLAEPEEPEVGQPDSVRAPDPGKNPAGTSAPSNGAYPELVTGGSDGAALRLGRLYPSLMRLEDDDRLDERLRDLVTQVVHVIPAAQRAALLLKARDSDALLLTAFHGEGGPAVSESLARRALEEGAGFIWDGEVDEAAEAPTRPGASIAHFAIGRAMVMPLHAAGEALGVLCLDDGGLDLHGAQRQHFTRDDLVVLQAVAQHVAMTLSNRRLREALRHESSLKANLLRQFSPQFREQLLHPGGLKLSGERSEVTILVSDIRGFESITRQMEPIAVVEMLNDYFSRLSPLIWANNGSIDKYIGDSILAVFGSPQKDPDQHENALRAALEMQQEMERSNAARLRKGKVTCEMGIGVHCGEVLHGFIGVVDQLNLTVIGDAVNRATRYCDAARGGEIMISPQVHQWVWKSVRAEPASFVTKHGETLSAFRLQELRPPLTR